jgi:16S rRNA processing protein RimM
MPHTDLPERFSWLEEIYVGRENPQVVRVESVRYNQQWVLLKLAGYGNREDAGALRGEWLLIPEDEAIPLEEDEYFLYQLIGLSVLSEEGENLGDITKVIETGANNVFEVQGTRGEILIPDTEEVVREIDLENGRVIIHILPGLLPT